MRIINASPRVFYETERFEKIYLDYLKYMSLSDKEKNELNAKHNQIKSEEPPALALKRHGTIPPENWLEISFEMNKRHEEFYCEHPYYLLERVVNELKSVVNAKNVIFVNSLRKGRAPIKEVNVIQNGEYLIFIYNRLVNSTQTTVAYSGVPIKYIALIVELEFLRNYIPNKITEID